MSNRLFASFLYSRCTFWTLLSAEISTCCSGGGRGERGREGSVVSPGAGGWEPGPLDRRCGKVVRRAIRPTHDLTSGYLDQKQRTNMSATAAFYWIYVDTFLRFYKAEVWALCVSSKYWVLKRKAAVASAVGLGAQDGKYDIGGTSTGSPAQR